MRVRPEGYIPAAGHDWLLPLYDPLLRLLFREQDLKRRLLDEAQVSAGDRVLDVGCGTGTMAVLMKTTCPGATVVGLDGDAKALAMARRKAAKVGVEISFENGLSYEMPYPDGSFERVLSSFVFHHLTRKHKLGTLSEVLRILVPGGLFCLLDFGRPVTLWDRSLASVLFRSEEMRDNREGRLASLMLEAGFSGVQESGRRGTLVGSVWQHRGTKPATAV